MENFEVTADQAGGCGDPVDLFDSNGDESGDPVDLFDSNGDETTSLTGDLPTDKPITATDSATVTSTATFQSDNVSILLFFYCFLLHYTFYYSTFLSFVYSY